MFWGKRLIGIQVNQKVAVETCTHVCVSETINVECKTFCVQGCFSELRRSSEDSEDPVKVLSIIVIMMVSSAHRREVSTQHK